jgi:hypothetical protein
MMIKNQAHDLIYDLHDKHYGFTGPFPFAVYRGAGGKYEVQHLRTKVNVTTIAEALHADGRKNDWKASGLDSAEEAKIKAIFKQIR